MDRIIIIYVVIMNLAGYISMGIDKRKAKRGDYRIPERVLFGIAIFGGSIGSIIGMQKFRHKTKHKSFVYGMPAILCLHIITIVACYFWFCVK
ncbi:MAG: DUF1294 domain-containing protein [Lachnospiraceae bacterium]|nr:DUF1294 domain-containing protein [Lachnospiraceae bacterium]